jgi:hypothetical protein
LARERRPDVLAELGSRLNELNFVGRPGFWANRVEVPDPRDPTETVVEKLPNDPEESAIRWLALPREERRRYHHINRDFLPCLWQADTLLELLRTAASTGEIILVEGPAELMDAIQLPSERQLLADGPVVRALRVEFVTDRGTVRPPEVTSVADRVATRPKRRRGPRPEKMNAAAEKLLSLLRNGPMTPEKLRNEKDEVLAVDLGVARGTAVKAREQALSLFAINCQDENSDKP